MSSVQATRQLDLRGKTITTYIVFAIHQAFAAMAEGDRVEVTTDNFAAIDPDIRAWCRATGHILVDATTSGESWRFEIEKGAAGRSGHKLAAVISDDGLFELLSPLGFALAAALEGHDVSLYFQGPAVRVLATGFTPKMHGLGRPFSWFPRESLAKVGHLPPHDKIQQLQLLAAQIYACGPSMEHYRVDSSDLAFADVVVAEYLTFIEEMNSADMHIFV